MFFFLLFYYKEMLTKVGFSFVWWVG